MKNIALLLAIIFAANLYAGAPLGVSGQGQTSNQYPSVLKLPNNLVTNIGSGQSLLENGNKNILSNPSFENSSTSWTVTGLGFAETSVVIDGKLSWLASPSASTFSVVQSSTLYAAQFADGVQGLAMVRVKTSVAGIKVCSVQAGTVSTTNCVTHSGSGKWELLKVPFILGATSNGISIATSASSTGNVYIDDAFVGAVDLKQDYNIATNWVSYTPNFAGFGTPTSVSFQSRRVGDTLEVRGSFLTGTNTAVAASITLGYNGVNANVTADTAKAPAGQVLGHGITNAAASTTYFGNLAVIAQSGSVVALGARSSTAVESSSANGNAIIGSGGFISVFFSVPISGWVSNGSVYNSTNADTSMVSFTPTLTNFGPATPSLTYRRDGQFLVISGYITFGGAATGIYAFSVPTTFNGQAITPNLPLGVIPEGVVKVLQNSSGQTYVGLPRYDSVNNRIDFLGDNGRGFWGATVPLTAVASDFVVVYVRIPIVGWDKSNVIIGQFSEVVTSSGSNGVDVQSVTFGSSADCSTVCSTGTCTICRRSGTKITSVTWSSAGNYLLNGIDGNKYTCTAIGDNLSTVTPLEHPVTAQSTSYALIAGPYNMRFVSVNCIGTP